MRAGAIQQRINMEILRKGTGRFRQGDDPLSGCDSFLRSAQPSR